MGFLREFGSKLGSAMKTLIGNDPEQYVEDVDGVSLTTVAAVGLKEGKINQKEAVELINAQRKNNEKAELVSQRVERDIVLTPREAKVLKLRFGLEDGKARTLEEVGKEFQVTRERIRQIEAKALRKLRHPSRSKRLKDYMS